MLRETSKVPAAQDRYQLLARRWKYACPQWRIYDGLVDERHQWLELPSGDCNPELVEARRPERVLLRPWIDPSVDEVEVLVAADGIGSSLTVVVHGTRPELALEPRKWVRYRIGLAFGASLREWVDGW